MNTRLETITPQIAAKYLSRNSPNNRRIKRAHVEMLARDMANGEFRTTHQGIAFDENGELIDGQHRLHAVMMSNTSVKMLVTRGCERNVLMAVDRGAARTIHDAMTIMLGGDDKRSIVLRNTNILSAMSSVVKTNISRKYRLSSSEAVALYDANPEIWNEMYEIVKRGGRKRGLEMAAYYAALVNGVPFEAVYRFDRVMNLANVADCEEYNVQVVLKWRRFLDDQTLRHIRTDNVPVYETTQSAIKHFIENTGVRKPRLTTEECYPCAEHVAGILNGMSNHNEE